MARTTAHSAVWAISSRQHQVISRDQLRQLGYTDEAIDHRVAAGRLHPVRRTVFAVGRPAIDQRGRWMAAILACGDGAVLSHESAAAHWGILGRKRAGVDPIHVSVPATQHPRHEGIKAHRRKRMPPATTHESLPLTQPLLTLIDLAATWNPAALEDAVNEADRLGVMRIDQARADLDAIGRMRGAAKLRGVLERHTRTDSDLERRFLRIAKDVGLPRPETQSQVNGFRVDFYWAELGLIVESDGLTYHRTPAQQAEDRRRDQVHTAAGLTCLRFTNAQVRDDAESVAETLRRVTARLAA